MVMDISVYMTSLWPCLT